MAVIILDRDGVINFDSDDYIKHPNEWMAIPGSLDAIRIMSQFGYLICIATNQSGIGRGLYSEKTLREIHTKLLDTVQSAGGRIDLITFCPHRPSDNCRCRKPNIGLLEQINAQYPLNADTDWMVGDSATDLTAAYQMGIRAALVKTGKGQRELDSGRVSRQRTPVFDSLFEFASWLTE